MADIPGFECSVTAGPGVNLIVYKKCCGSKALKIENEAELLATIAAIASSIK
jgi:hypothetical protein